MTEEKQALLVTARKKVTDIIELQHRQEKATLELQELLKHLGNEGLVLLISEAQAGSSPAPQDLLEITLETLLSCDRYCREALAVGTKLQHDRLRRRKKVTDVLSWRQMRLWLALFLPEHGTEHPQTLRWRILFSPECLDDRTERYGEMILAVVGN